MVVIKSVFLSRREGGPRVCVCVCLLVHVCAWVNCITRTSSCGNGPREFSGTLIGGMTQSLFMRLSELPALLGGKDINFEFLDWAGGSAASWI